MGPLFLDRFTYIFMAYLPRRGHELEVKWKKKKKNQAGLLIRLQTRKSQLELT